MFRIYILASIVFFNSFVNAADIKDSLKSIWLDQTQLPELRLESMGYVCDHVLLRSNPDSAYTMAKEMENLALSSGNTKYKADALRIQGEANHFEVIFNKRFFYLNKAYN